MAEGRSSRKDDPAGDEPTGDEEPTSVEERPARRKATDPEHDDGPAEVEPTRPDTIEETPQESPWSPREPSPADEPDAEPEAEGEPLPDWPAGPAPDRGEEEEDVLDWEVPPQEEPARTNVRSLDDPRPGWSVKDPSSGPPIVFPSRGPRERLESVRERAEADESVTDLRARWESAARVRGSGPWAAVGWIVLLVGLILVSYAYYELYLSNADRVLDAGGVVRLDVLGFFLVVVGGVIAGIFYATPNARIHGPGPESDTDEWLRQADRYNKWERTHRSFAAIGWGLVILGLVIAAIIWFTSWRNSTGTFVEYGFEIGDAFYLYWRLALLLTVVGAVLMTISYPRIRNAREAQKAWLLATLEAARADHHVEPAAAEPAPAEPVRQYEPQRPVMQAGVAGVHPEEIKRLMRRIDEMLSRLPDTEVAEFAKSPEADAYLKILEDA